MRTLKVYIAAVLITAGVLFLSQETCAVGLSKNDVVEVDRDNVSKIEAEIAAAREQIIKEDEAIKLDVRKLKEIDRMADKAQGEAMKREINQDIKNRKAAIKSLKAGIRNKKFERNDLVYSPHMMGDSRVRKVK